jgi:hypothetical protein
LNQHLFYFWDEAAVGRPPPQFLDGFIFVSSLGRPAETPVASQSSSGPTPPPIPHQSTGLLC